jgi:hypothetical protein
MNPRNPHQCTYYSSTLNSLSRTSPHIHASRLDRQYDTFASSRSSLVFFSSWIDISSCSASNVAVLAVSLLPSTPLDQSYPSLQTLPFIRLAQHYTPCNQHFFEHVSAWQASLFRCRQSHFSSLFVTPLPCESITRYPGCSMARSILRLILPPNHHARRPLRHTGIWLRLFPRTFLACQGVD